MVKRQRQIFIAWAVGLVIGWMGWCQPLVAQNLILLRQPQNAALSLPVGQGLDLLHSAEPLGKGRLRLLMMNRSHNITVAGRGEGSAYTGNYGLAYGLSPALDLSLVLPFYMDTVILDEGESLNKYGNGDLAVGIKWSRPSKIPSNFYMAGQLLIGLPLAYKGAHKLDREIGRIPGPLSSKVTFSSESIDLGMQLLADLHFRYASVFLNGGYFSSGNAGILPQLVYGVGLEVGRRNRWASFNAEYQARVAFTQESKASGILKLGTKINIIRGIELEFNREYGLLEHPIDAVFTLGLRTHGFLGGGRRLEGRYVLYTPPPPVRRIYQPSQVLRLAIVDFEGFEHYHAGSRLIEKIKTRLEPHDSLEVVDLRRHQGIPRKGYLKPEEAMEIARKLGVDVVVTGTVSTFKVDRFTGVQIPYLIKLPEDRATVGLRYRVLEFFGPNRGQVQAFLDQVDGQSRLRKRVRLLPSGKRDITASATAVELHQIQDKALDDLAGRLLASMAVQFSWMPPDFLP